MSKYMAIKNGITYMIEIFGTCTRYSVKGGTINVMTITYFGNDVVYIKGSAGSCYSNKKSRVYQVIRKKVLDAIF